MENLKNFDPSSATTILKFQLILRIPVIYTIKINLSIWKFYIFIILYQDSDWYTKFLNASTLQHFGFWKSFLKSNIVYPQYRKI